MSVETKRTTVMTQQKQKVITPDSVLDDLLKGNENFVTRQTRDYDYNVQLQNAIEGQYPKAIILSCVDSRVPVEIIFNQGIGDVFVARVAGNVVDVDVLASMEYACSVIESKLVLILGHTSCGAVTSACQDIHFGNVTKLLHKIKPAIANIKERMDIANEAELIDLVTEENVRLMINETRRRSKRLRTLEIEGKIKIVGGIFDLNTGKVTILK